SIRCLQHQLKLPRHPALEYQRPGGIEVTQSCRGRTIQTSPPLLRYAWPPIVQAAIRPGAPKKVARVARRARFGDEGTVHRPMAGGVPLRVLRVAHTRAREQARKWNSAF